MWLISIHSYELRNFSKPAEIPLYAILSHTWGDDEVSFEDMRDVEKAKLKKGFRKIEYSCHQAELDKLSWAWVDTCCIDKSSSAELSEAINSMFLWYSNSVVCYVYLEDIDSIKDWTDLAELKQRPKGRQLPRWFTRGWTLQELIAPTSVLFFSASWQFLGSRLDYQEGLATMTGITYGVLNEDLPLDEVPVATRMSWAAQRETTRKEDEAYCLLGIFNVNMPLLYGEGGKSFQRLLDEILKTTDDQTIFLCGMNWEVDPESYGLGMTSPRQFLARSVSDFNEPAKFRPTLSDFDPDVKITTQERGVRINARMLELSESGNFKSIAKQFTWNMDGDPLWLMGLNCSEDVDEAENASAQEKNLAILLRPASKVGDRTTVWARCWHWYVLVPREEMGTWPVSTCYVRSPKLDDIDEYPKRIVWKTKTFGYGDKQSFHTVDILDFHLSTDKVDATWGLILDQSRSLPWIAITIGTGAEEASGSGFCDVWQVPEFIKAKVIDLEEKGMLKAEHRALILCQARLGDMHVTESGPIFKNCFRNDGPLARSSCLVEDRYEFTAVLMNTFDLSLSIRDSPNDANLSKKSERSDRAQEVWSSIEASLISSLHRDFEEDYPGMFEEDDEED